MVLKNDYIGNVHSVFHRVVNIIKGNQLITLTDDTIGDVPNGIRVKKESEYGFDELGIAPGSRVESINNSLIFENSIIKIYLNDAEEISSRQKIAGNLALAEDCDKFNNYMKVFGRMIAPGEGLCPLWHYIDALVNQMDIDDSSLSVLCRAGFVPLQQSLLGLKSLNARLFYDNVNRLVGLGVGLTPSGDDILTGLAGSIILMADKTGRNYLVPLIKLIPMASEGRTNIIAHNYIVNAVNGEVTGALANYINALATGPLEKIEPASRFLFNIGGTSGGELALGAFLGVLLSA